MRLVPDAGLRMNVFSVANMLVLPLTKPNTVKPPELFVLSREAELSTRLKKNWEVALSGLEVLAIATVPATLLRNGPVRNSFVMGGKVAITASSVVARLVMVKAPPWITKL